MRGKSCFCVLVSAIASLAVATMPAFAEDEGEEEGGGATAELDLKGAKSLHPLLLGDAQISVQVPDEHLIFMVEDALEALGKEQDILVLSSPRFKNGVAYVLNNTKILVVDENEFEPHEAKISDTTILNNAVALLTLGHEIGHHVCGHLTKIDGKPWQQELEADEAAGAILSRSEWMDFYSLGKPQIMDAAQRVLGSEEGSGTHPPLKMRLAAIESGWKNGAKCGASGGISTAQ